VNASASTLAEIPIGLRKTEIRMVTEDYSKCNQLKGERDAEGGWVTGGC